MTSIPFLSRAATIVSFLAFFLVPSSWAASVYITDFAVLPDPTGELSLEEVVALDEAGRFSPLNSESVQLGYSRIDHWFRVGIDLGELNEWMTLEIDNPRLGDVTLFAPTPDGKYRSASAGVRRPFWERNTSGLSPAFPFRIAKNQQSTFYFRVKNFGSLRFDLRLATLSEHNRRANYSLAYALLVAGALLVLGLYNFCIFLHLRQASYFWIALFLLTCTLWQMAASGTANMFLWPNAPLWSKYALLMTGATALLIGTFMANALLEARSIAPTFGRINVSIAILTALGAILSLSDSTSALYLFLAGGLLLTLSVTAHAVYTVALGFEAGMSFLKSWGIVLIGCLVTILIGPGYLPANPFTIHVLDMALLCACLGWSFSLTGRVKIHEDEQRQLLESKVRIRTAELRAALDAVKTLEGLLPICSCCKKIRNDRGYWQHVESYLQEHTEADFSHGICPECAHTHYPEYFPREHREQCPDPDAN